MSIHKTNNQMETQKSEQLNRGEFLRSLGMSSAALMAVYCMGTLTSCSSSSSDPTPSTGTGTGTGTSSPSGGNATVLSGNADATKGAINFIVSLSDAANSPLTANGGYMYVNSIIIAKTTSGSYVALTKVCTHQGTTIIYKSDESNFFCPNHESRFADSGAVKSGIAPRALQAYKASLSADGKQLTITA